MKLTKTTTAVLALIAIAGCASEKKKDDAFRAKQSEGISAMADNLEFEKAKSPPIAADTQFAAGQLAESQGNFDVALQRYEQALQIDPKHQRTLYRSAVVYTQLKQYPTAIGRWNRYVEASHGNATGYNNLGFCYELSGDGKAAEGAYLKGIAKDPKNQRCRVNYGLMLARQDRMTDAITQLRAVLTPVEVAYNIGSVHEMKGRKEQAKAEYQKALSLDPDFADARTRLAALE